MIFLVVIYWNFPPASPEDILKTGALILVMLAGGMLFCSAFCALTAWLTYRQYARTQ